MTAVQPQDLLFYAGGECLQKYGTLVKRTAPWEEVDYTHSRSSSARAKGRDGQLRAAKADVPRTHYVTDENGILVPATLLESGGDNELTRVEELDHADWTADNLSARNADQATGPDGVASLDELVEDGTASVGHAVRQDVSGMTADANYALSCWAIADTRSHLILQVNDAGATANFFRSWFDLSAGTAGTTSAGGAGALVRAYVRDWTRVVAGLYRLVVVGSVGNSATTIRARFALADDDNSATYNGDGSSGLFAGYAMLEDDQDFASSYIPKPAAGARSADLLTFPFPHGPQAMTLYAKFVERGNIASAEFHEILQIGGNGNTSEVDLQSRNNAKYAMRHNNGSVTVTSEPSSAPSIGDVVELCGQVQADGKVRLFQSIEGGPIEDGGLSGAPAGGLLSAFASQAVSINSRLAGNGVGWGAVIDAIVAKGVKSMADMRQMAGA